MKGEPPILCRGCGESLAEDAEACAVCHGLARLAHPELTTLTLAHLDCDAFYASIEKRDDPSLAARPVIVGGGTRGVVATACYIARAFGVRSAMPMFKALKLCPDAVVIKPNIAKYAAVGADIRARMQALTPLVEPLSIDEAFMDLSGTEALHGASAAAVLARLQTRIEAELGLTVSIGLSFNKFLAKFASDLDKPRGFSVIGHSDALAVIGRAPAARLPGVGPAAAKALNAAGLATIADIRTTGEAALMRRFGDWGQRLFALSMARDDRRVDPDSDRKTVSAETTFAIDVSDFEALCDRLWPLCEAVAARARAGGVAGRVVTLKLKSAQFKTITRQRALNDPTRLAQRLFSIGKALLETQTQTQPALAYRLIGIGLSDLTDESLADKGDLMDQRTPKAAAAEDAIAAARARFGKTAIVTGRTLKTQDD